MHYLVAEIDGPTDARVYKIEPRAPANWRDAFPWPSAAPRVSITVNHLAYVGDLRRAESDYLVASARLVSLLRELGDSGFEDFAVEVIDFCSGEHDAASFRILRLLGDISCLDVDETAWHIDETGRATRTRPAFFNASQIPKDRHLFWMRERPMVLVASGQFKAKWDAAGLKGPKFYGLEGPLKHW